MADNIVELIMRLKDEVSGELKRFEDKFTRLSAAIKRGALVIGGAIVGLIGNSVRLAAAFEEASDKFDIVFGENSPAAREELEKLAQSLGRSSRRWIGFAATIQDTLVPLGFARADAADMSVKLIALAADMSSLSNVPMEQVIMDLQSALVGNVETLRKYGVALNQETIQSYALEEAIWNGTEAITAQEKAAAILGLTYEGTADAQGNALETADSFTNTMRSASDQLYDFQVELGERLLPIIAELVSEHMPGFIDALENMVPPMVTFITNVANLADLVINFVSANKQATESLGILQEALDNTRSSLVEQVARGFITAEEATMSFNEELTRLGFQLPDQQMLEFAAANGLSTAEMIRGESAVRAFSISLAELTLVQLENMRVIMHSLEMIPGISTISRAAFEQLNAEVTERLVPSVTALGTAAGGAITEIEELWERVKGGGEDITPPGTISEEEVSRQIARQEFLKEQAIENAEEIALAEEEAAAELFAKRQASFEHEQELRRSAEEAAIEEQNAIAEAAIEKRLEMIRDVTSVGISGAREIGREWINQTEGWEERALQAIALMVAEAAAVAIGGPIGGVLSFVTSLFQKGGKILHAQSGVQIPKTGHWGDRQLIAVEGGEVWQAQQAEQGMIPGQGGGNTYHVTYVDQSLISTGTPSQMVRAGRVIIEAIEQAGGSVSG